MATQFEQVKVTLIRSTISYPDDQRLTASRLGLRHIRDSVVLLASDSVHGMLNKITHLIQIEVV